MVPNAYLYGMIQISFEDERSEWHQMAGWGNSTENIPKTIKPAVQNIYRRETETRIGRANHRHPVEQQQK